MQCTKQLTQDIFRNLANIPGWRTNRKIIVIESDDWGAIRMSSNHAYQELRKKGIIQADTDDDRYLKNDSLESENDLIGLFEVLSSVKDQNDNHAQFTILGLVSNPVFEKIKQASFEQYFYEPITDTFNRYPNHNGSFKLWEEGRNKQIFFPQFHGREHLNVQNWLIALKKGEKDTLQAFDYSIYGITPRKPLNHVSYQAAFDFNEESELEYQRKTIIEGLDIFKNIHGFPATFFVPTNGPFNNKLLSTTANGGITAVGVSKIQDEPIGKGKTRKRIHYLGQQNQFDQIYLTRNCFFEPSSNNRKDWIKSCLQEISIAFRWHKPAIISSHRVNYIGWLNPKNRDNGLLQLSMLLKEILKLWPDVEFMTSHKLAELIRMKTDG